MIQLPPEILQQILTKLPIDDDGARVLAHFSMVSTTFLAVARDPVMWKPFYTERCKHADPVIDTERRERLGMNWCSMYYERRLRDSQVLQGLSEMVETPEAHTHLVNSRKIVEQGLDAYDALVRKADGQTAGLVEADPDELFRYLVPFNAETIRKTWAYRLLCIITAQDALKRWTKLKLFDADKGDDQVTFEEAFSCLSSFHGIAADDV